MSREIWKIGKREQKKAAAQTAGSGLKTAPGERDPEPLDAIERLLRRAPLTGASRATTE